MGAGSTARRRLFFWNGKGIRFGARVKRLERGDHAKAAARPPHSKNSGGAAVIGGVYLHGLLRIGEREGGLGRSLA